RGERLLTWRLPSPPEIGVSLDVEQLPDHRKIYLEYEGPVSRNRGRVRRWDGGLYEILFWNDKALEIRLLGTRLQARCVLRQTGSLREWSIEWLEP
ncbi:MAG TPA: hypothetical protein EYP14_09775, partial [Planctomycetaceae bacterium]|nr:hypothetical protein [Planctomycetaceae bacterium]